MNGLGPRNIGLQSKPNFLNECLSNRQSITNFKNTQSYQIWNFPLNNLVWYKSRRSVVCILYRLFFKKNLSSKVINIFMVFGNVSERFWILENNFFWKNDFYVNTFSHVLIFLSNLMSKVTDFHKGVIFYHSFTKTCHHWMFIWKAISMCDAHSASATEFLNQSPVWNKNHSVCHSQNGLSLHLFKLTHVFRMPQKQANSDSFI